jgi:arsenite-transporting ATPase
MNITDVDEFLELLGEEFDDLDMAVDPTINDLLNKSSLKWIFVGGKGGVGKTTCSCSIATLLSQVRKSVLIISTDPAHNLSDAFGQKFNKEPTLVEGWDNLYAMEINPTIESDQYDLLGSDFSFIKELTSSIPGIDEAMGFAQIMKLVQSMEFEVIVFDTAPTGHTLRFLALPEILNKGLDKLMQMKNKLSGIFSAVQGMMGAQMGSPEDMVSKMEETKQVVELLNAQFKDKALTTFVCVCIPEFLSVYETERLVRELASNEMDVDNIIVNQVVVPEADSKCTLCLSRVNMQTKYIEMVTKLYQHFHVIQLPLQHHEIRGAEDIKSFARLLRGHSH